MSSTRVAFVAGDTTSRDRGVDALGASFGVVPLSVAAVLDSSGRDGGSGGPTDDGNGGVADGSEGAADDEEDAAGALAGVDCVVVSHGNGTDRADALAALRALADRAVPVVLFTADGDESLATEAFRAGAADYVKWTADGEGWTVLRHRVEHAVAERRAEDRLAENERTVSTLVENLPGVVYRTLPGGEVSFLGGDVAALTGHTAAAFDGSLSWWEVVHPDDRARVREAVDEALRERRSFEVTYRIRTDDGPRWVTDRGRGVFEDGDLAAVEGVLTDVTERKRRDEQVRDLHDATRRLVTAETREGIAEATAEAASEVLGYPVNGVRLLERGDGAQPDRLVPAAMSDATTAVLGDRPDYLADGTHPTAQVLRTGEAVVVEDPGTIDDERDRSGIEAAMYLPLGEYGTLSIAATGPATFDEDDRRLAELLADNAGAALAAVVRREALENERDRLAALFENVPEPTVRVAFEDGEPRVREVNPAFEETFGYDEATVRGRSIDEFVVPPADRDRVEEFNRRIQAGEPFDGEVRRLTADGPRDFLLHVIPRELDPTTTEGFAIYTDITDRKSRERELERQNERLEEFASVLSHDLRNPLNVAAGRLELYRETGDEEALDTVAAAHERIRERIEDLLDLARQGRTVDDPEPVPLTEAVQAAWSTVDTGCASLVDETGDAVVHADRPRLERLLENLFRNSVEHGSTGSRTGSDDSVEHGSTGSRAGADGSPGSAGAGEDHGDRREEPAADGGTDLTVTVGLAPDGDGFFVADDGVGIPDRVRDEVFDSGVSTADGTGFGLAIVQSIAEAHGWSVRLADGDGGARFAFDGVRFETGD